MVMKCKALEEEDFDLRLTPVNFTGVSDLANLKRQLNFLEFVISDFNGPE